MCHVYPSWLSFILYNPFRKKITDRRKILHESCIAVGSVVFEIGAGNVFLTEVIADIEIIDVSEYQPKKIPSKT